MIHANHHRIGIETLLIGTIWLGGWGFSACTVSHQVMRGSVVAVIAKVIEILGEHYAAIELIEGELWSSDIVEKSRRQ